MFLHRKHVAIAGVLVLPLLLASTPTFGRPSAQGSLATLEMLITHIKLQSGAGPRIQASIELVEHLNQDSTSIDANQIDQIASLLDDENDRVRYYAAVSLGLIGRPAARATPALRRALEKAYDYMLTVAPSGVFVGTSSAEAICSALELLGTTPSDSDCLNGHYVPRELRRK